MIFEKIRKIICEELFIDPEQVTMETSCIEDLGADSLDLVDLTMVIEETFSLPEVTDEELKQIVTVGDLVEFVGRYVKE